MLTLIIGNRAEVGDVAMTTGLVNHFVKLLSRVTYMYINLGLDNMQRSLKNNYFLIFEKQQNHRYLIVFTNGTVVRASTK